MLAYETNQPAIDRVWARLQGRIAEYPPALRQLGETFLSWAGPGYFSLPDAAPLMHLPLWMRRGLPDRTIDDILEAAALAYAYVRIQDNVVDEPNTRGNPPMLHVANAMLWDSLALFRKNSDPRFWTHARDAWFAFSEMTEAERRQLLTKQDYPDALFAQHARKCALAEVPVYAVMSATGDWRGHEDVVPLIHTLARSYGAINDVFGYERDLLSGGNTWLLARARAAARKATGFDDPSDECVREELTRGDHLERAIDVAIEALDEARLYARQLDVWPFESFAAERTVRLYQVRARVTMLRLQAALAA